MITNEKQSSLKECSMGSRKAPRTHFLESLREGAEGNKNLKNITKGDLVKQKPIELEDPRPQK